MERKLAAILNADVEGYSRLMGDDEAATVQTLTGCRELMSRLVHRHGGRDHAAGQRAEGAVAVMAIRLAVPREGPGVGR